MSSVATAYELAIVYIFYFGLNLNAGATNLAVAVLFLLTSIYLYKKCPETANKMPLEAFPEFRELEGLLKTGSDLNNHGTFQE